MIGLMLELEKAQRGPDGPMKRSMVKLIESLMIDEIKRTNKLWLVGYNVRKSVSLLRNTIKV
jgi:hypothetical protein